jgi:hypothetical protein
MDTLVQWELFDQSELAPLQTYRRQGRDVYR